MNPATTKSPMLLTRISARPSWTLRILTSRRGCSCSEMAKPMAPLLGRHQCPPMSILRLTKLPAPLVLRGRNGLGRAPEHPRSRRNPCSTGVLLARGRTRGEGGFRISTLPRSRGIHTLRIASPSVGQLLPAKDRPAPNRSIK